jgi:hypothetical protein
MKEDILKKIKGIFKDYLINVGKLPDDEICLGSENHSPKGTETSVKVITQQFRSLAKALNKEIKFNGNKLIAVIGLLCLNFAIGAYFSFHYRHQPDIMKVILGGTFSALLALIKWLHALWKEKNTVAVLMRVLGNISLTEAAEFVLGLYNRLFEPAPVIRILIISANPMDTQRLNLEKEVREIKNALERSMHRSQFEVRSIPAVRPADLRRALLDYKPKVVHFSGHGDKNGLSFVGDLEVAFPISSEALSRLFKLCANHVECVIINACYSKALAAAIGKHIDCVIGMNEKINDRAAFEFAVGFYDALGAEKKPEEAFEFGCNAIELIFPDLTGHSIPVIKTRKDPKKQENIK